MVNLKIPRKKCGLSIGEAIKINPDLNRYIIANNRIDLGNTEALLLYNQIILKEFLDLDFTVPLGFLVPTICSRWKFIEWILSKIYPFSVLEIGTGSSAVLALILAKIGCEVEATEINDIALESAHNNIKLNELTSKITLLKAIEDSIVTKIYQSLKKFDAIICNPPQYDLTYFENQQRSNRGFVGQESELVGGVKGYEFIFQLIKEINSYKYDKSLFFQITSLKIVPTVKSFLETENYDYIEEEIKIGTRGRYYFQVKFARNKPENEL